LSHEGNIVYGSTVRSSDARPAGKPNECFYCQQPVGQFHTEECVVPKRIVWIRMSIQYPIAVPASWDHEMIRHARNDSTWCASNAVDEVVNFENHKSCLCKHVEFEYVREATLLEQTEMDYLVERDHNIEGKPSP